MLLLDWKKEFLRSGRSNLQNEGKRNEWLCKMRESVYV